MPEWGPLTLKGGTNGVEVKVKVKLTRLRLSVGAVFSVEQPSVPQSRVECGSDRSTSDSA